MPKLPQNLVRRGSSYYFRTQVGGRLIRVSLGDDLSVARQRAAQLRQKYRAERHNPVQPMPKESPTFEKYAEEVWFLQHVAHRRRGRNTARDTEARMRNHVFPVLGRLRLDEVTSDRISPLITVLRETGLRRKKPLSDRTIGQVLADIRACLNHALRHGHLERIPRISELIPRTKRRQPPVLTVEEIDTVLGATKTPEERLVIEFAIETGLRRGALAELHWRHVRLRAEDPEFVVETSKSGQPRTVPLSPKAVALLQAQKKRGSGVLVSPLNYDQIGRRATWIRKRTGVKFNFHRTRATFTQSFLDAGGSVEAVSKILGHAEITTTAIYGRPSDRLVRNEARRVWIGTGTSG